MGIDPFLERFAEMKLKMQLAFFTLFAGAMTNRLSLRDGRQLYVNPDGWAGVAHWNAHTNHAPGRNTWTFKSDGTVTLTGGSFIQMKMVGLALLMKANTQTATGLGAPG